MNILYFCLICPHLHRLSLSVSVSLKYPSITALPLYLTVVCSVCFFFLLCSIHLNINLSILILSTANLCLDQLIHLFILLSLLNTSSFCARLLFCTFPSICVSFCLSQNTYTKLSSFILLFCIS
jgi:hypothetical protein